MLAPRASSAFVCLRCELKLARPRISPLASQSSHTSFSTSARRNDGADEPQTLTPGGTPFSERGERSDGKDSLRISREDTSKGRVTTLRRAKLGMKRMDEDADILVLNDVRNEPQPKEAEVLEPISVPDILSSLEQDSAPATQEDVEKQLESLRPNRGNPDEPQYVTTADFVKLVAALTRGFTSAQLSGYYSTAKSIKKDSVYKVVKATVRATKRSQWYPTTTNIEKRLPDVEATSGKKQKTKSIRQATLVDKILRDVWKLELLEELEAPGELELRLKEWQLKLLQIGGDDSTLARIARVRNAKAEIHWTSNVLRITADKVTAEYTADDVEATLSKAYSKTFTPEHWKGLLAEQQVSKRSSLSASLPLDYVSSLTGTYLARNNNKDTIQIYGLDAGSVKEARRTLTRLLPFKEPAQRTIDTQRLDAQLGSYLVPVYPDSNSLDYINRDALLGRWMLPVSREADSTISAEEETEVESIANRVASLLKPPVHDLSTGTGTSPRRGQAGYWTLEPEYKLSADFGQSLFSLQLSDRTKVAHAITDASVSPFQPAIPGLGSLLASSDFEHSAYSETSSLLYDFLPAPDQKHVGPHFPRLFIQVRPGRDGNKPTIHKLSLGFHMRIHDVLLPDQSADIRFHRYGRLRFSIRSHHDKNVEAWSEAVRQNIESGERLSAPSLTIDIPKWTIPSFPPYATGMVQVKYLFQGIQFRQSVSGRMLDTQVSYSTVQSGKLGAQSSALTAYPDKLKGDNIEMQIRDFATKCIRMVDYITQAGAQTQLPKHIAVPRKEYSERKQRRAAQGMSSTPETMAGSQDLDQYKSQASNDYDPETQDETDSLDNLDAYADLTTRLDDATTVADAESAFEEAYNEADGDRRDAKSKVQQQEADALLEDLFGDTAVEEATEQNQPEVDSSKESEKS
ncbi:hypothetical protein G6514_003130 [Epicoccum nigrum]|nr:hypothetical protein G6514_003130 [Epicoccum nigrum]